jgi:DNA polymerase-3 subunit alpha
VLVKGRVDHKEAGKTCVVVQSIERFAPTSEEIEAATAQARARDRTAEAQAKPMRLRVSAEALCGEAIEELKQMIEEAPGAAEIWIELDTSAGTRRLRLGEEFRVRHTPTLRAELEQALGRAVSGAARAVVGADSAQPSAAAATG